MFVRYGRTKDVPAWVTPLLLAEQWGTPPWVIERERGSMRWAARKAALDEARRKSNELDRKSRKT